MLKLLATQISKSIDFFLILTLTYEFTFHINCHNIKLDAQNCILTSCFAWVLNLFCHLQMFDKGVLRRIFGPEKKVTGGWTIRNEQLHTGNKYYTVSGDVSYINITREGLLSAARIYRIMSSQHKANLSSQGTQKSRNCAR